jgi:hypothetical protein
MFNKFELYQDIFNNKVIQKVNKNYIPEKGDVVFIELKNGEKIWGKLIEILTQKVMDNIMGSPIVNNFDFVIFFYFENPKLFSESKLVTAPFKLEEIHFEFGWIQFFSKGNLTNYDSEVLKNLSFIVIKPGPHEFIDLNSNTVNETKYSNYLSILNSFDLISWYTVSKNLKPIYTISEYSEIIKDYSNWASNYESEIKSNKSKLNYFPFELEENQIILDLSSENIINHLNNLFSGIEYEDYPSELPYYLEELFEYITNKEFLTESNNDLFEFNAETSNVTISSEDNAILKKLIKHLKLIFNDQKLLIDAMSGFIYMDKN